jgi:hypothetical protein
MKAALAGQQSPVPEDLLAGIEEFPSLMHRSELEIFLHHWIERAQRVFDNNGDYVHEQIFYDHYSFQFFPDGPGTTTYRPPINPPISSKYKMFQEHFPMPLTIFRKYFHPKQHSFEPKLSRPACNSTQVSHGLEKTLANLPLPIELTPG